MLPLHLAEFHQNGLLGMSASEDSGPQSIQRLPASERDALFTNKTATYLITMCETAKIELETAKKELEVADSQSALLMKSGMPHRVYGADLKHDGLEWVATFGRDSNGVPHLVGRGNNPAAALYDFDKKWLGVE